jgi:hypothetical protein
MSQANCVEPTRWNRRAFLGRYAGSVGSLALAQLLGQTRATATTIPTRAPRAKAIICLFQHGGPSQIDLFDAKPELTRRHGEPYPGELEVHFHKQQGNLLASPFKFQPYGQCGMELSELLPHTRAMADELTLVRSMSTESVDHEAALRLIHTGKIQAGRPTWGAWATYGLGQETENLPSYVVLTDPGGLPIDGVRNWSSGWLPARYQGTPFRSGDSPVLNLVTPAGVTPQARLSQLEFLQALNRDHQRRYPHQDELEARIRDFEMAARMQTTVPRVLDLSDETEETQRLYGLDDPTTEEYGRRCLWARRLVEQGVPFVQVYLHNQPWDTHSNNAAQLKSLCARHDKPSAALVQDLKRRGLLESTIVLWTGEFGRLPISQGSDGRDHNRHAFSLWMAGGGMRPGYVHGATDEFGYRSVEKVVTVHDLHATLLAALGLDHRQLTYPYDGREDSLTDEVVTSAKVVDELFG